MRTRNSYFPNNSSVTIPRRRNKRRTPNVVEPELRTIIEVAPMADNRTMEELLQAPTKGYGEAIVILKINADHFEIKTNLLQLVQANPYHGFERENPHTHINNFKRITSTLKFRDVSNDVIRLMMFPYSLEGSARVWFDKEPPNSILTWEDLINKFVNQFFPPSKTTHLKNEISRFTQRFEETFREAWERFKEMLRACPHHGFTNLAQIDTFYNGLNDNDQDSLNAATGGNLLSKTTREALNIIENKSKVRYSRNKPNISRMNITSREKTSKMDDRIDKLVDQISTLVDIFAKKVIIPALVKAVEESCVTCGGPHAHYNCDATNSNQPSVCAAMGTYNQVAPQNRATNYMAPFGFAPVQNSQNSGFFQNQSSTSGTLSSNTIPNPKGEMKAITTRSGVAYEGPLIPTHPSPKKVVERETEETTDKEQTNFQGSTAHIQPPVTQIPKPDVTKTLPKPNIPYPLRLNDQKIHEKAMNQMENRSLGTPLLGRSFLRTGCALIDVYEEEIAFWVNDEVVTFNLNQTTRYSSTYDDLSVNRIDIIDVARDEYAQEILGFFKNSSGGNTTLNSEPMISDYLPSLTPLEGSDFILEEIEAYLKDESQGEVAKKKSSIEKPPKLELKDLSSHLEYTYLEGEDKLPAIIAKDLKDNEKEALLKGLKSHKRAIAWKIPDIKGIDPQFCTHKILIKEDYKPEVQSQRRFNLKIHELIKKEVIKLLDAGMIYSISDSPWVSPIHYVPKKGGITVVENENNELIPTRLSKIARPMTRLFEKETLFVFSKDCIDAFKNLKKKLTEAPILVVPDWNLPFELMCDASDFAIGAVLGQRKMKHFQPIHYASKTMTEAQIHYTTTEKEMLSIVCAFEKFRPYIILSKSIVYMDHSDLKYLLSKQDAKPRLENPHTDVFENKDINGNFPLETLGKISSGRYPMAYWALKHVNFDLKIAGDHQKLQLNELNKLRDQAYENSLIYKEKTKKLHDSKIKNRIFNVGDRVLLFNSRLKIFSGKLKTRWSGPFTITKVFPYGTVELSQPDGPNFKVNGYRVKHYFGGDVPQLLVLDLQTFPVDK
nr:reverse transcriptase domain-containing protein [Tanacetum cinerariifolium]